jgi:choline dehydrogenase-like flavoprotein
MPRLKIDLRYSQQDVDSVIRAHQYIDEYVQRSNAGYLAYKSRNLEEAVWAQAADGYHQIGTTRMSESPRDGVVNRDCRVHGIDNLYVASSSVFVRSGQLDFYDPRIRPSPCRAPRRATGSMESHGTGLACR